MPRRAKKTGRRVKRRAHRRLRRGRIAAYRNPVKRGGFPDTYSTPLEYLTSVIGMGDNTNTGYQKVFALNDPTNNNTVSPLGWSILSDVYDTYLVHACKMKLVFQNTSATIPCRVVIAPMDVDVSNITQSSIAINLTSFNLIAQSPYSKVYNLSAMGGGKDTVTVSRYIKLAKYAGEGRNLSAKNDRFLGQTGSSNSTKAFSQPTALYRWVYAVVTSTGVNLSTNMVVVSSVVTFYTQFMERLAAAS